MLCCRAPAEIGGLDGCVTGLLDLVEGPWRLIEHSQLIHPRTTNGDTPEAEAACRTDPTSSASLTPRTLAGNRGVPLFFEASIFHQ